ncbi:MULTISPECIES: hypothetical protein [unclassified Sphingobium]|uniref:hypothetical protein n=1 Tax=unclassified Sphingobium TaxID=2611147 RepID=UPI0005CC83F5|nr:MULTISPECIES: hypothetical protein [unclassified Sphingobium]AJR22527.1 hypothetical protein TZ53_00720 [Sphingobium sp. YBL2]MCB4858399.1 hypothetical protein [Sphingobium sp. PNB]UXC89520.1 hypothetical protein EGM87_10560 [Sphingobium sp. RSMS]
MNWRKGFRRIGLVLFAPIALLFVILTMGQLLGGAIFLLAHWLELLLIFVPLITIIMIVRWVAAGFKMSS